MSRLSGPMAALLLANSCAFGPGADFTLRDASAESTHACLSGSSNAAYDLHATIDGHNGTSGAVSIKAVSAVMTLAAVHGGWLQKVGYVYDAGNVAFAPTSVGAGSDLTLKVTVPSACTNRSTSGGLLSYGDYSLTMTVTTSAGTFKVEGRNKHRIIAS
jgi:hypothetical protein